MTDQALPYSGPERRRRPRHTGPLSEAARRDRRERRAWATPGSSHDTIVGIARIALPASVVALVLLLAIAPIAAGREISFVLSKNRVQTASERMRVTKALYRGADDEGQPFALSAASAVQTRSTDTEVRLSTLNARLGTADGPATLTAPAGRYNMADEQVSLDGPVAFRARDGYAIDTRDVDLDMKTRMLASRQPVSGRMPLGTFRADRLEADLNERTVVLKGRARLHIDQGRGKPR